MIETTESFLKVEAIFHQVLEVPSEERDTLIAILCDGDASLIAEVKSLLTASDAEQNATTQSHGESKTTSEALPERSRIGPYQLDRILGRGGMGAVYLAHRVDGQFEQQVAIKLIDLPLATDVFRERFRQERQILAGLHHPFIARLLDGGVTSEGDLYLAMDFVDGVPIDRFCDQSSFSIHQRLELFLKVCEAVQFAHQNLVVHRDLKPDNILVADDGTPRLLDFGTAKLLSPSAEKTGNDFTRQGFQSFTPQYASPEQVLGNPITTASDTYSLGVLLYVLLTGTKPYILKELTVAEMVRVICEEPPRKPSSIAASPNNTHPHIDPDLEAILLKALRKEPSERYLTVEQFASDIQDYLAGRPVAARRGDFRYHATKFIRRNRLPLAGAAVLAATLIAGVAGVLWQAKVANQERRKADARSADLRQLSNSLLSELDEAIKQLPGSTGAQQLLVLKVTEHLDRMAKDATGDRDSQIELVEAYTQLAKLQGDPYDQNLGDPTGGLNTIGKALAIAQPLAAASSGVGSTAPKDRQVLLDLADAQVARSEILFGTERAQDAIASMQEAVKIYDQLLADPKATPAFITEVAAVYGSLGDEEGQAGTSSLGDHPAALAAYRKTIALDNRALTIDPNFPRARRGLAIMQMKIGSIEMETDPAAALKDFQIALQRTDALPEKDKGTLAILRLRPLLLRKEANAMVELGDYSEAHPLFQSVYEIQQALAAQDPKDLRAQADLSIILDDEAIAFEEAADPVLAPPSRNPAADRTRNLTEAVRFYSQVAAIVEHMLQLDPSNNNLRTSLAIKQVLVGTLQQQLREPGDSAALAARGLAVLRQTSAGDQASAMSLDQATNSALKILPENLRDPAFAIACAERGVKMSRRQTPSWLLLLAQSYHAANQIDKAHAAANEGLALLPPYQPGTPKSRIRKLLEAEEHAS